MDYSRIYTQFIADRRTKEAGLKAYERHHIHPRSLGGGNGAANVIRLHPGDHFFAHLLLAKIHGGKMNTAAHLMWRRVGLVRGRIARDRYIWLAKGHAVVSAKRQTERMQSKDARMKIAAALRGVPKSPEAIERAAAKRRGRKMTDEARANMRAARLGKKSSPQHRANMSTALKGRKLSEEQKVQIALTLTGHAVPEAVRAKISAAIKGRPLSEEHRAKISAAHRGKVLTPEQCQAISDRQKGERRPPRSEETRAKLRAANIGKTLSPEHRAKIGAAHRARIASLQEV